MGSLGGFANQALELGEDLFDRVQARAAGREEQQARTACPNGGPHGCVLVAGEVFEDDDIAWCERRAKLLRDPGGEAGGRAAA